MNEYCYWYCTSSATFPESVTLYSNNNNRAKSKKCPKQRRKGILSYEKGCKNATVTFQGRVIATRYLSGFRNGVLRACLESQKCDPICKGEKLWCNCSIIVPAMYCRITRYRICRTTSVSRAAVHQVCSDCRVRVERFPADPVEIHEKGTGTTASSAGGEGCRFQIAVVWYKHVSAVNTTWFRPVTQGNSAVVKVRWTVKKLSNRSEMQVRTPKLQVTIENGIASASKSMYNGLKL